MARAKNPFVVTGKIEREYFCDRVAESKKITKSIENGNNIVLISPRRMGKTGLVHHCYDFEFAKDEYYTFFIDILHTTSLQEFTYLLGRKIYETVLPKSKKMMTAFIHTLKSISGQFGFDPISNTPTFDLSLGDIVRPELTLEEIFYYLEHADRPCVVTIDEFQQIAKYPEKNVEALLRTHIQAMSNCQFIFAGSEYHIMQEMFVSANHPFYNSADILELRPIELDKITSTAFIKKHKLASASANQYAAKQLMANGVVTKLHGKYSLNEQFFDIWINRMYGKRMSAWSTWFGNE